MRNNTYHIGTAGYHIGKALGMMGVSGAASFEVNFARHSQKIGKHLRVVAKEFMVEAMTDEVIATLSQTHDEMEVQSYKTTIKHAIIQNKYDVIPSKFLPFAIAVSYDMGWQKKGSGKQYDSNSGHGYFIGCRTGKVVTCGVLQKLCSICTAYERRQITIPEHVCNTNHTGSSGGMEARLCRQMLEEVYVGSDGMMEVKDLVTDDDSTLRDHCSSAENGGKLRPGMGQPKFLADPTHRTKVMSRPIFNLVQGTKNPDEIKMIDALRLKKYISCYILQNRNGDFDKFVANAKAPVEHLFDNHEFCDESWCYAKELTCRTEQLVVQSQTQQVISKNISQTTTKLKEIIHISHHYCCV